jgi:hypothetical protein
MAEDFSISRLLFLRKVTRAVSDFLLSEVKSQLNTLSPLLRPRRMLGDYIESGSPEPVVDADKNFAKLNEIYTKASGKPFELPRPLRPPLKAVGLALDVNPWEYSYELNSAPPKAVTVTSPVKWVVSYTSGLSFSRLRQGLAGREELSPSDIKEHVIRCCLFHAMINKYTGIRDIFAALRWEVATQASPETGGLSLTTLTSPIPTMLPPDEFILESTEMSGTSRFEEVVDVNAVAEISDPLTQKVNEIIQEYSG